MYLVQDSSNTNTITFFLTQFTKQYIIIYYDKMKMKCIRNEKPNRIESGQDLSQGPSMISLAQEVEVVGLWPKKGNMEMKFVELLRSNKSIVAVAHFIQITGRFAIADQKGSKIEQQLQDYRSQW
ncbi:hypothetical protein EI94DRAFT_1708143 [Lactarius quietus]|nr:hypothetical protein EI94DRAFT_1708143 [Lactarius quietus]